MSNFDAAAGLGPSLTRRPLYDLPESDQTKSTNEPVLNYGSPPSEKDHSDPNTRFRPLVAPKFGQNDQTNKKPGQAAERTKKAN